MSQTLLGNDFKWDEDISEFNENLITSYNNKKVCFLKGDIQYLEN